MIVYAFSTTKNVNAQLSQIVSAIESATGLVLHTPTGVPDPPGTASTGTSNVNGYVGVSCSPSGCTVYVHIFESTNEWPGVQISGVKYVAAPPSNVPSQETVQNAIAAYL